MTTESRYQGNNSRRSFIAERKDKRVIFGVAIIIIGIIVLIKKLHIVHFPFHVWPLVVLAIGLYLGVKHQFKSFGSWVLISIGILFLIPRFFVLNVLSTHLIGPVIIILLGLYLIVKPRRRFLHTNNALATTDDEDSINIDVTFGERTSVITSKNFKGGYINNSFGSTKINMIQAESNEPMTLDMRVSFGSVELIIPSHWDVELQVDNSFATIEDKRYLRVVDNEEKKKLILKGSCSFGSITVKSA